jgi:FMN phosphatase YigB (HAD superfamily)
MTNKPHTIILFDLDDTLFDSTNQPKDTGDNWPIHIFEEWRPLLESKDFTHILVTRGQQALQDRKIDILGIRKYFSKIYICEKYEDKYDEFNKVKDLFPDVRIIVIGNRIDNEIRYGNMLGLTTIHIKHGKHKNIVPSDQYEIPTHALSIHDVNETRMRELFR